VENSVASNNIENGILAADQATVRVSRCLVTGNATGLNQSGTAVFQSLGNNLVEGNVSDTAGTITAVAGK
jgi:hypothetical protein